MFGPHPLYPPPQYFLCILAPQLPSLKSGSSLKTPTGCFINARPSTGQFLNGRPPLHANTAGWPLRYHPCNLAPLGVRGGLMPKSSAYLKKEHKQLVLKPLPPRGRGWGEVFDRKYEIQAQHNLQSH